jgi:hypothetical protein
MTPLAMPERDLQAQVLQLAGMLGWLVFHPYNSQRSTPGFPDLVLVHEATGALLFAELKQDGKHPTAEQQRWLDALGQRHDVHVWRPADLRGGVVSYWLQRAVRS